MTNIESLIRDLETAETGSRELDARIHEAIGWVPYEEYDECSQFTPGARWVAGAEYYESLMRYYFPPDLREQYEEMFRDEGEEPPADYDKDAARDWWMSDEHLEQYPAHYTTSIDAKLAGEDEMFWLVRGPNAGVMWYAQCCRVARDMSIEEPGPVFCANARTEPLARRIAALKARQ